MVTVREVELEEAVMVTDVAFVACQVNVTTCPAVIALVLAEKIIVGAAEVLGSGDGDGAGDPPPQLIKTVASVNGKKVRTCRARERVRIATSQVRASFGAGLGCSRFTKGCMSTRGERGGNALKRSGQAFHSDLMGQKGVKQLQIRMYSLDLELLSTAGHTFRLEGIR